MSPSTMHVACRVGALLTVLTVVPWAGSPPSAAESVPINLPNKVETAGTHELALIGDWGTGEYHDVFVQGDYAFAAADRAGLDVIDVSDPTSPVIVSSVTTEYDAQRVHVLASRAYVVSYRFFPNGLSFSRLQIFDVSDPLGPVFLGQHEPVSGYHRDALFVSGDYAYVDFSGDGIDVLNVSDPTAPSKVGAFRGSPPANDIFVVGDRAYLGAGDSLYILNVSNPSSPSLLGVWNSSSDVDQLYVVGDYAYLAAHNNGLRIVNVSDPTTPTQVGQGSCYQARAIHGDASFTYVSGSASCGGVRVFDVSTPSSPSLVGSYGTDWFRSVFSVGTTAYLSNDRKFEIADVSVPPDPEAIGGFALSNSVYDVAISDSLAFLATQTGVAILDLTDPSDPSLLSRYSDMPMRAIEVGDTYAYAGIWGSPSLHIVDIADPANPAFVSSSDAAPIPDDFDLNGDYLYFATSSYSQSIEALTVFDISNPSLPWVAGSFGRGSPGGPILVRDQHAYLTLGYKLRTLDIDPPWDIAQVSAPQGYRYHDIDGSYLFQCDADTEAFRIFDISDPTSPILESSTPLGCSTWTPVAVGDGYAYIDAFEDYPYQRNLYVLDVSDPTAPFQVGAYPKRGRGRAMKLVDDFLYLANQYTGKLLIYRVVSADLSLTKIDSVDPVTPGTDLSYTLTVTNSGWSEATEVVLTDTLPDDVSFLSAVPGAPTCTETSGVVTCNLGSLASGASSEVPVITRVNTAASGTLTNTADVFATQLDWDSANNVAAEVTTVGPPICDLAVLKTDSADPVDPGDPFTYTVSVGNYGPSLAGSVTMTDPLPEDVLFVSVDPGAPTCTESAGTVTCNLGPLDARSAKDVTIEVGTNADFMGSVTNVASVTGPDLDPVLSNNEASEVTQSTVVFTDGFESGDTSAWSSEVVY